MDGKHIRLAAGMNLTAGIKAGKRRVIDDLPNPAQRGRVMPRALVLLVPTVMTTNFRKVLNQTLGSPMFHPFAPSPQRSPQRVSRLRVSLMAALCCISCPATAGAPQEDWASLAARIKKVPELDGNQLETLLHSLGLNHTGCRASSGIPVELDCGSPAGLNSMVALVDGTHLGPKDAVTDISIRFMPRNISTRPRVAGLTQAFPGWTQAFEFNEHDVKQMRPPSCLASLMRRGSQWKVRVGIVGHDEAGHCANDVQELSLRVTRVAN